MTSNTERTWDIMYFKNKIIARWLPITILNREYYAQPVSTIRYTVMVRVCPFRILLHNKVISSEAHVIMSSDGLPSELTFNFC